MVSVQVDLTQYEEINRSQAMRNIRNGEKVTCRLVRNNMNPDIYELSIIEELTSVILEEQKKLCEKVEFYKKKEN